MLPEDFAPLGKEPRAVHGTENAVLLFAGLLRDSVVLRGASSCQFATGIPWQVVEFTDQLFRLADS